MNLDCDHAQRVLEAAQAAGAPIITFSQKDPAAQVYASDVHKEDGQILFTLRTPRYTRQMRLTMPGLFNVENALGAAALCEALDIPEWAVYDGLVRARVPGRMEVYANADGQVLSIVDYAHNRLSFETLFSSVRAEYPQRELAIVFGCPGKKAYDRRHDLGEAAGAWCDRVYLTEEDSGEEDTLDICQEIRPNVEKGKARCRIIANRGEAIRQAVLESERPTVLLLTGKGRETRQKRGTEYIDTPTDVEYVQAFLQEYDLRHRLTPAAPAQKALETLPALEQLKGKTFVICLPENGQDIAADVAAITAVGGTAVLMQDQAQALSTAQSIHVDKLIYFVDEEPSLALGENRQAELLRMDGKKAAALLEEGALPASLAETLKLALQAVEGGVGRCVILSRTGEHVLLLDALGQRVLGICVSA